MLKTAAITLRTRDLLFAIACVAQSLSGSVAKRTAHLAEAAMRARFRAHSSTTARAPDLLDIGLCMTGIIGIICNPTFTVFCFCAAAAALQASFFTRTLA